MAPDPTAVNWINPQLRAGEVRKVVTGIPGKTGVVYTLDRETGDFLWATPTITQNVHFRKTPGDPNRLAVSLRVVPMQADAPAPSLCPSPWRIRAILHLGRATAWPLRPS